MTAPSVNDELVAIGKCAVEGAWRYRYPFNLHTSKIAGFSSNEITCKGSPSLTSEDEQIITDIGYAVTKDTITELLERHSRPLPHYILATVTLRLNFLGPLAITTDGSAGIRRLNVVDFLDDHMVIERTVHVTDRRHGFIDDVVPIHFKFELIRHAILED